MKIHDADNREMMRISALERDGSMLVIKGEIFGTLPLVARLRPEEARAALRLLRPSMVWFLLTLLFRRRQG